MNVRIVLPIELYGDSAERKAIASWLRLAISRRIDSVAVTHRNDQGIVIVAPFDTASDGLGAIEAAGSVLELIRQALETDLQLRPTASRTKIQQRLNQIRWSNVSVRP